VKSIEIELVLDMIDKLQYEIRASDKETPKTALAAIGGLEMLRRQLYNKVRS
jgi:hypothetical protein